MKIEEQKDSRAWHRGYIRQKKNARGHYYFDRWQDLYKPRQPKKRNL